jgi:hypothetical protein
MKPIINEIFVSMHIIGKILEGSHNYINIQRNNVQIGAQDNLFNHIEMDAKWNKNVKIHMDGKNKSTILTI